MERLPDFGFYETEWNCMYPAQWGGIPLMQIPEWEYDMICGLLLDNCSAGCVCYHSWKFGDIIIANCSHVNGLVLTELPAELSDSTSHLNLSHNKIKSLCGVKPYFNQLQVLDLSVI